MTLKLKPIIEVLYTVSSLVGAYLIATNDADLRLFGYFSFLTSSFTGIWLLLKSNASISLTIVSLAFLMINVKGIISSV
jgi:hypothetical protein